VVVLTIFRRQTSTVDRSFIAWATAFISMIGPSLVRAVDVAPLVPDAATAAVSGVGVCIVIVGKLTLGRSFGIIAANRGVVASGPYKIVRHPIYVGYLLTHVAFAAAHPTALNIALIVLGDSALIIRALCEERTLVADERYREYCHAVAWHFVPGVF
jgi:protein-S-isoprenylcysteine O-methyltransferase Ste14